MRLLFAIAAASLVLLAAQPAAAHRDRDWNWHHGGQSYYLGISSGGVTGVTDGPASRWAGSSASDARLGGSTGTATPCRDTAGTDRDGIRRLQASISDLSHADQRSGQGDISADRCAVRKYRWAEPHQFRWDKQSLPLSFGALSTPLGLADSLLGIQDID